MATDTELDEILSDIAEAFPDWKPGSMSSTFAQYKEPLRKYTAETLRHAARRCMDSCVFFPKIAEIRKAIAELPQPGNYQPESWDKLVFVPPPPEFTAAMDKLLNKWGISKRPKPKTYKSFEKVDPQHMSEAFEAFRQIYKD